LQTSERRHNHCDILIEDCASERNMLGPGQGHLPGQYRLGPGVLAPACVGSAQAELALDMMVKRSLER